MIAPKSNFFSLSIIVAIFSVALGGVYALVMPALLPGYKTYSVFLIGVGLAALLAGYVGFYLPQAKMVWERIVAAIVCAIVVAMLVSGLSLLIILNVRGS